MRRSLYVYAGAAILAAIVAIVMFHNRARRPPQFNGDDPDGLRTQETAAPVPPEIAPGTNTPVVAANPTNSTAAVSRAELEEEREKARRLEAILETWQAAMDENDNEAIRVESIKLMRHLDPEVRASAVEGFAWIGPKGLVPLTEMLRDRAPEVAKEAAEAWLSEMRDLEDGATKAELLGLAAAVVDSLDEETLLEILDMFSAMPEILAARQVYEMLLSSKNPDYIREMLDTLNFIMQPEVDFGEVLTEAAKQTMEKWLEEHKNDPIEWAEDADEKDDE